MGASEHSVEVIKSYLSGKTLQQVGKEFGCSYQMVSLVLKNAGIPTRPKTPVETEKLVVSLCRQGLQNTEIRERTGLCLAAIYNIKKRNKLPVRRCSFMTKEDIRMAMLLYEEGMSTKTVGDLLGFSQVAISNHLNKIHVHIRTRSESYQLWKTKLNPDHKPGRIMTQDGYVLVLRPDHPQANKNGYIREHRLVAEQKIGRPLTDDEVPHHLNGIKNDNRPDNLCVLSTKVHAGEMRLKDLYIKELQKRIRQLEMEVKQKRLL